ncbi:hypothetical protein [Armatimonas sp.]|uniref:hypothetical protein n=1 Tax=Armatimonas sp. TaxID=1872638 RepID=UPI00286C7D7D|nr:hypothetical protein [Armatimonas sp.]
MKNLYQPYSVPAMADPAPLEKRLRHILFGRGGYTMRHAMIPLVLGVIALGALLPLRFKTSSPATVVEAVAVSDIAIAQAPAFEAQSVVVPLQAEATMQAAPDAIGPEGTLLAQEGPERVEVLQRRAADLEAELARTRQAIAEQPPKNATGLTFHVPYRVPNDGRKHHISILVEDSEGTHTGYDLHHAPGTVITAEITAIGRPVTIKLYDNNELKAETRVVQ